MKRNQILAVDQAHLWHPYARVDQACEYVVRHAQGAWLMLDGHDPVLDGMASWWACIHGYNHKTLNAAMHGQIDQFSHVMFGGLTHEPAAELAEALMRHLPQSLTRFFFTDSGSVSVEVAVKLALQYQMAKGRGQRKRLAALRGAYHGDTFAAMSLCDPDKSMHHLFSGLLPEQTFLPAPTAEFNHDIWQQWDAILRQQQDQLAAVIIEPLLQGAGGMKPYAPEYLRRLREVCSELDILLIADEIATGFGRTGSWFACERAQIEPDVMCLGKALTGGYMTMAAMVTSERVAQQMSASPAGVLMHGPTFMANPLACRLASASVGLLASYDWQTLVGQMAAINAIHAKQLAAMSGVASVRTLGNILAVDLEHNVEMQAFTQIAIANGIWLRPFGKMVYMMPPYLLSETEQHLLGQRFVDSIARYLQQFN